MLETLELTTKKASRLCAGLLTLAAAAIVGQGPRHLHMNLFTVAYYNFLCQPKSYKDAHFTGLELTGLHQCNGLVVPQSWGMQPW